MNCTLFYLFIINIVHGHVVLYGVIQSPNDCDSNEQRRSFFTFQAKGIQNLYNNFDHFSCESFCMLSWYKKNGQDARLITTTTCISKKDMMESPHKRVCLQGKYSVYIIQVYQMYPFFHVNNVRQHRFKLTSEHRHSPYTENDVQSSATINLFTLIPTEVLAIVFKYIPLHQVVGLSVTSHHFLRSVCDYLQLLTRLDFSNNWDFKRHHCTAKALTSFAWYFPF